MLLNDRLEAALARAQRASGASAVMFLDLDHFKDVNDTLGHRVGDLLLKELARRLRAALRQTDLLARISGDEFVMVLEDLPDDERARARRAQDARRGAPALPGRGPRDPRERAASGSRSIPRTATTPRRCSRTPTPRCTTPRSSAATASARSPPELAERRTHRLEIENGAAPRAQEDELALHYQPIVDLATGEVTRAEALLRWHDPERGLVLPADFIPLAEESGLGHAVGQLGARGRVPPGARVARRAGWATSWSA